MSHRPPLLAHPLHQQQASLKRQTGITVGHEDLRDVAVTVNKPHLTRRSSSRQRPATGVSPTSWPGTARPRFWAPLICRSLAPLMRLLDCRVRFPTSSSAARTLSSVASVSRACICLLLMLRYRRYIAP